MQIEHNGPWKCIAEDDREDEDEQYVFLDVKNSGSRLEVGSHSKRCALQVARNYLLTVCSLQFQLLTDQADQRVYEREGRDAVLECPTNAYSGFVKCTFTDPFGNDFLMVGR